MSCISCDNTDWLSLVCSPWLVWNKASCFGAWNSANVTLATFGVEDKGGAVQRTRRVCCRKGLELEMADEQARCIVHPWLHPWLSAWCWKCQVVPCSSKKAPVRGLTNFLPIPNEPSHRPCLARWVQLGLGSPWTWRNSIKPRGAFVSSWRSCGSQGPAVWSFVSWCVCLGQCHEELSAWFSVLCSSSCQKSCCFTTVYQGDWKGFWWDTVTVLDDLKRDNETAQAEVKS